MRRLVTSSLLLAIGCGDQTQPIFDCWDVCTCSSDRADGCGGVGGTGGEGGSAGSGAGGEPVDDLCHFDCFGWNECEGGVVTHYPEQPVPCAEWTGSCPHIENAYVCEKGCTSSGYFGGARARDACEEWRSKTIGDACASRRDCLPAPFGTYLLCDMDSSVCISSAAPTVGDLWMPCGVTADDLKPTPGGYATGVVPTGACLGGWCMVVERDECILQGCTQSCEWDQDCPEGTYCDEFSDLSPGLTDATRLGVCDDTGPGSASAIDRTCP